MVLIKRNPDDFISPFSLTSSPSVYLLKGRNMKINIIKLTAIAFLGTLLFAHADPASMDDSDQDNSAPAKTDILTPPTPSTPAIHGAKVYGAHPGSPFLFVVAATGDRPMTFSAEHLPVGLALDSGTGLITGTAPKAGDYTVTLHAKNSLGEAKRKLLIKVGDTLALTPPMGWNSWNCYADTVSDEKIRTATDAMVSSGLINHGWSYINLDDCWAEKRDSDGTIHPNSRFPDMKALADYIHAHGLKAGLYSSPGPLTCGNCPGSFQHEEQDAQQYAAWGFDYLKYDWCSYGDIASGKNPDAKGVPMWNQSAANQSPAKYPDMITKSRDISPAGQDASPMIYPYLIMSTFLREQNRDIVFSFCQYGYTDVWKWGAEAGGNSWRTTLDLYDDWNHLMTNGSRGKGIASYVGPGHWNDPDMLVVGSLSWGHNFHPSGLTHDEQYTHISLWCLQAAPLLLGCDLTNLDPFTLGLLTNDEVLDVDQDPLGQAADVITPADGGNKSIQIWARKLEDGSTAVGLFNLGDSPAHGILNWSDLHLTGSQTVRDLWRQKDLGTFDQEFDSGSIPSHGVVLIRLIKS
jgi:alpha-galactosidase